MSAQILSLSAPVSFEYEEVSSGVFVDDDACIEVDRREAEIYSVTRTYRFGGKRLLGGIEQISSEQWVVRWIGRGEVPLAERVGMSRIEAISHLAATTGVR
jgi:hypothetical protein